MHCYFISLISPKFLQLIKNGLTTEALLSFCGIFKRLLLEVQQENCFNANAMNGCLWTDFRTNVNRLLDSH